MPGLLNLIQALGFSLDHRKNLGNDLHQFGLGRHTSASRKVLKACTDQLQVITGGCSAPSLAEAATLTAPYGVSL